MTSEPDTNFQRRLADAIRKVSEIDEASVAGVLRSIATGYDPGVDRDILAMIVAVLAVVASDRTVRAAVNDVAQERMLAEDA